MKPYLLGVVVLSLPAFGQTITGTVEKIGKDQLEVKGTEGPVTLHVDEKTTVRKVKQFHDLSALVVGDEVRVNYYGEGTLAAVNISAKIGLSGVITEAGLNRIMVLPALASDARPPERKAVFVFLNRTTQFGISRGQLTVGRKVHIVGWDTGDGVVEAERVASPDSDVSSRPPARPKP